MWTAGRRAALMRFYRLCPPILQLEPKMARELSTLRNIGIIAHIDAGKTTVTEQMQYMSGAKHRAGSVDSGTTETDDDPEEQQRGITIYAACITFRWKDITINLLDTPGHVDFTAEVERCLRVLDGAVVVFSAREGVEAQSETVWRQANKYAVPRIVFINKLDREGADFYRVLEEIGPRLNAEPVAIQIPVGQGPAHTSDPFRGVVDLIEMKLMTFDASDKGKTIIFLNSLQNWWKMPRAGETSCSKSFIRSMRSFSHWASKKNRSPPS